MGLFDFFKNKKTNSDNSLDKNKFDDNEIVNLVKEIESVQFKEFWYGSNLLEKATQFKDERITRALTMRHYFLENKIFELLISVWGPAGVTPSRFPSGQALTKGAGGACPVRRGARGFFKIELKLPPHFLILNIPHSFYQSKK